MRTQLSWFGWGLLRRAIPQRWYWRGWLAVARLLILVGFPLHRVGALLSARGPAVAGWWRLYGGRS
jgi:hypothetical protein